MSIESTITDLVQTLEDGRKGFADAAQKLADDGNTAMAESFRTFAQQRASMSAALRSAAASSGTTIDEDGSIAGALHRGWIALKDAVTGNDADAILNAAVQGEDHAISEFEDAVHDEGLPASIAAIVREQLAAITSTRDRVAALSS